MWGSGAPLRNALGGGASSQGLGGAPPFRFGPGLSGPLGGLRWPCGWGLFLGPGTVPGGVSKQATFFERQRQSLIPGGPRKGPPLLGPGRGRALPDEQRSTLGEPAIVWQRPAQAGSLSDLVLL